MPESSLQKFTVAIASPCSCCEQVRLPVAHIQAAFLLMHRYITCVPVQLLLRGAGEVLEAEFEAKAVLSSPAPCVH